MSKSAKKKVIQKFKVRFIVERVYKLAPDESFEDLTDSILDEAGEHLYGGQTGNEKITVVFDPF